MSYVLNNHLKYLYVLSDKAVGPGKNPKLINIGPMIGPTSIPEARVLRPSDQSSVGSYCGFRCRNFTLKLACGKKNLAYRGPMVLGRQAFPPVG